MHKSHVKYEIKRVLAKIGYRTRMGTPARTDLLQAVRHLRDRGLQPQTVIDVGVADGTYELYTTFPQARHLLIEPMQEFEPALQAIAARWTAEYIVAAADERMGEASISVAPDLHGASLLSTDVHEGRVIPTVTLDSLIESHKLWGPHLLKIDVQGAELRVLAGATQMLRETAAIILEASMIEFEEGTPLFDEIIFALKEMGFVPYDIFGGYNRPLDGALAQLDMIFVPIDSPLRSDKEFASSRQWEKDTNRLVWRLRRRLGI